MHRYIYILLITFLAIKLLQFYLSANLLIPSIYVLFVGILSAALAVRDVLNIDSTYNATPLRVWNRTARIADYFMQFDRERWRCVIGRTYARCPILSRESNENESSPQIEDAARIKRG